MSDTTRKIAVIVALDVAGYSARTEADEAKTTAEVAALRTVIEEIAKTHGGRVFNTAGDGFMLEFGSSLAAVEAAGDLAAKCEPKVRVGVHLGDVVVQPNGDLLGHGVNVAARLMARSDPGAALISADVRRTIRGPLAERLVSRGPMQLDKMAETIEAFSLGAALGIANSAPARNVEPLLAVLPFDSLSDDKEMQFFSEGVSEDVIYALVHGAGLDVIGRTSAFHFRGERKADAARALKATHVLDGSVRRSGSHIRITAHLVEASTGRSLWTDRYDRDLSDILALQDEIATQVTVALRGVLPRPRPPAPKIDPAAYELALRAVRLYSDVTYQEARAAEELLQQCVALAPAFARAWAGLAITRVSLLSQDTDSTPGPLFAATRAAANRALELDPDCAQAHQALAGLEPAFSRFREKMQLLERSVSLAPADPWILTTYAGQLVSVGRIRDASAQLERAETLEPMSAFITTARAATLCNIGRLEEGLARLDDARRRLPDSAILWQVHWTLLVASGRTAEAEAMLAPSAAIPRAMPPADIERMRLRLSLAALPQDQHQALLGALLDPARDAVLRLELCITAAYIGCVDLTYDRLFSALDTGRPIGTSAITRGIQRSNLSVIFFGFQAAALRADERFPLLCARLGLVDYWRQSGHWPDCATDVPYDFKAECEKAMREVPKA
jgi:adenylate cyclase